MIDISVIIPCYNREATICRAIDSVINQTFNGNVEIIVSDDGSCDRSIQLIKETYGDEVVLLEKPFDCCEQGASGARNRGLKAAKGKYVSFLDSDDYYHCNYLQILYNQIEKDPELGYVFCRVEQEKKDANGVHIKPFTRRLMTPFDKKYHVLNRAHCIYTICQLIKRETILKVGLFDKSLKVGEDSDMWIRISEVAKGKFIDYVGAVYCIGFSDNQLTATENSNKQLFDNIVYERAKKRYVENSMKDKIRLALIYKGVFLNKANRKAGLINKLKRQSYVFLNMFIRLPIATVKVYLNNLI